MRQYVIYARKSSESEERQALSIPSQIEELEKLAVRENVRVTQVFQEAQSAKEPGRPVFDKLIAEVNRGRVAGILCWKPDRLSRNAVDAGWLVNAMDRRKLDCIITPGRTFRAGSDDKFMLGLEFTMGKKYVDDLSDNVTRGMEKKRQMGWIPYKAPVGWLNEPRLRTIVKDPDAFPIVRRMWELVLAHVPPSEVLRLATNEWGFRTRPSTRQGGGPLSRSSFYAMFKNPFYMGLIVSGDDVRVGSHEPMVTREEYEAVQRIMGRELKSASQKHAFALAGVLRCGTCDGYVGGTINKGRNGKAFAYYRCTHRRPGRPCREPHARAEDVEGQFAEFVGQFELSPAELEFARKHLTRREESEAASAQEDRRRRHDAIADKERALKNLVSLRTRDLVSDPEYIAERGKLLSELEELRDRRASTRAVFEPAMEAISFVATAKKRFLAGDHFEKQSIAKMICSNQILTGKKLLNTTKKPFDHLLDEERFPEWWARLDQVRNFYASQNQLSN